MLTRDYLFRNTDADSIIGFFASHVPEAVQVDCEPIITDMVPLAGTDKWVRAHVTLDASQFRAELTYTGNGRADAVTPKSLEALLQKEFTVGLLPA